MSILNNILLQNFSSAIDYQRATEDCFLAAQIDANNMGSSVLQDPSGWTNNFLYSLDKYAWARTSVDSSKLDDIVITGSNNFASVYSILLNSFTKHASSLNINSAGDTIKDLQGNSTANQNFQSRALDIYNDRLIFMFISVGEVIYSNNTCIYRGLNHKYVLRDLQNQRRYTVSYDAFTYQLNARLYNSIAEDLSKRLEQDRKNFIETL